MNDELTNKTNMIGACIAVAETAENRLVWDGKTPAAFGTDLAELKTGREDALEIARKAASATTGTADDKATAEAVLETAAFAIARAAANHFKKTGDLTRRAKVNFTRSGIVRLREQALLTTTRDILATATTAKDEPGATDRGLTPAALAALSKAIGDFERLLNQPRGGIANRNALLADLKTRVAGLMDDIADLDDLVIQFGGTEAGDRFVAAWKKARSIIDAGHGPGDDKPADGGTTTPPASPKP
jgi:hypothetical protein